MASTLNHAAVVGAAGKMGSGIAYLLLKYLAEKKSDQAKSLILIDRSNDSFSGIKEYLFTRLTKDSEKNLERLRELYPNCQGEALIQTHLNKAFDLIQFSEKIEEVKNAEIVFEVIFENYDLKTKVLKDLKNIVSENTFFYTNTSAIPIGKLAEKASLDGRLIGFHFYNPPAFQKLVELIVPEKVDAIYGKKAEALAKSLNKTVVHSNDHAGFIGNGYFARECLLALELCKKSKKPLTESICFINEVTEKMLVRPMGIFQLMDYVGVDVIANVIEVMNRFGSLDCDKPLILKEALSQSIKGGQKPDGSQKNGFFKYDRGKPVEVYSFEKKGYLPLTASLKLPKSPDFKLLAKQKEINLLIPYFKKLNEGQEESSILAKTFLHHCYLVANDLVIKGTAKSIEDVGEVLKLGFHHLYGPDFFKNCCLK